MKGRHTMKKIILTVLGQDHPGIVSEVTGVLFKAGCNIEDSSMTILEGEFVMLLVVSLPAKMTPKALQTLFGAVGKKMKLTVNMKDFSGPSKKREGLDEKNYIISVIGADKPGIVHRVTKHLADHNINITDVQTKQIGEGKKQVYAMILEIHLPSWVNPNDLDSELTALGESLSVDLTLKPIESLTL